MTLCNNFQRKWGVGIFSGVGVFSRGYSTSTVLIDLVNDPKCICELSMKLNLHMKL